MHPTSRKVNVAMSLGSRLREERERLRLSQAEFAERAGTHRNSQVRYENDKREPDSGYLETVKAMGVDVDYVLFGVPEGTVKCPYLESQDAPATISLRDCRRNAAGQRASISPDAASHFRACQHCPKNPIRSARDAHPTAEVNGRLLAAVLESIEDALMSGKAKLSPKKKARIASLIYRTAVVTGVVDPKAVRDAISVARD